MFGRVMRIHPGKTCGIVFDHAGNAARFYRRWNRFFERGLEKLNKGEKEATEESAKAEAEKPEPEPIKCPSCGVLHLPMPICGNCGFEFPKRSMVATVPGTLKELIATGNQRMMMTALWPQLVDYVLNDRKLVGDAAQKKASGLYKGITGEWPKGYVDSTTPIACTPEVKGKIRSRLIAFAKGKKKEKQ